MINNFILSLNASAPADNYDKLISITGTATIVFFILAAICLIAALVLFFTFNIPNVIGDLTGKSAKKAIEKMRQSNEESGNKAHRPHPVAVARGTVTQSIKEDSSAKKAKKSKAAKLSSPTEKIDTNQISLETTKLEEFTQPITQNVNQNVAQNVAPPVTPPAAVNSNLAAASNSEATTKLEYNADGTQVLNAGTTVLTPEQTQAALNVPVTPFKMIQDIVLVHTQEVI